jgi:HTH-type transcriptional repressor of NAD biosynthesis genes
MPRSIILMTALVPTIGHRFMIDFAATLGKVEVIICGRTFEPVPLHHRYWAFVDTYPKHGKVRFHMHADDSAPQNPSGPIDNAFWAYWVRTVNKYIDVHPSDVLVASEGYGIEFAKYLGCQFMPCDPNRRSIDVRGTDVRRDIFGEFQHILPSFRPRVAKRFCLFGAESVGKSTLAQRFHRRFGFAMVPEWAREYQEMVGPEITPEKMRMIENGQYSIQKAVEKNLDSPFIIRDTDLLSTIGYYRIMGQQETESSLTLFAVSKSDFYFLLPDNIPFTPDALRYGGDKRESDTAFWRNLLDEFGCEYYEVTSSNIEDRVDEIWGVMVRVFADRTRTIREFEREAEEVSNSEAA